MLLRVVVLAQRTLTLGQVQADAECAPQGAPLTVHIFPQDGAELAGPSLKRQCNEGGSAVSGVSGSSSAASCLAFYVRMADHPGKFDIEAAKSFALVPRLHYAALKRGESVVASALPSPPAFVPSPHSPPQLTVLKFKRAKSSPRPFLANRLPSSTTTGSLALYSVKALALAH
jgi:hypothetical protein